MTYTISDMILYTDNDNLRDAIIALDNYDINQEPYDSEIEDYMNVINESKYGDTLEELNHKLREASRIGDVELQKYYLEQIVNKKKLVCNYYYKTAMKMHTLINHINSISI